MATVSLHTSATTTTAQQGGTVTITARFDNTGPNTAVNTLLSIITSTMPTATPVSWTATYNQNTALTPPSGPASGTGAFLNVPVTIPPGAYIDVAYTLNVPYNHPLGDFTVYAYSRPAAADFNASNFANRDDVKVTVYEKRVELAVSKVALTPVQPGRRARFEITVTVPATNGTTINTGSVLSDALPSGFVVRSWTATYAGGASGPAAGSGIPVTLAALPPGSTAIFTIEVFVKSTVQPGAGENCAKVQLPRGYVIDSTGQDCVTGCTTFIIEQPVAADCHQFAGQVSVLPCDYNGSLTGQVKIELVSPNGKVWRPDITRCHASISMGAPIIAGWMETVEVGADGCWTSNHMYPRNGDLAVPCEFEDCHPATYYKITETVGYAAGASVSNTYHVRLWADAEYPPIVQVADYDELNPFCFPREANC